MIKLKKLYLNSQSLDEFLKMFNILLGRQFWVNLCHKRYKKTRPSSFTQSLLNREFNIKKSRDAFLKNHVNNPLIFTIDCRLYYTPLLLYSVCTDNVYSHNHLRLQYEKSLIYFKVSVFNCKIKIKVVGNGQCVTLIHFNNFDSFEI